LDCRFSSSNFNCHNDRGLTDVLKRTLSTSLYNGHDAGGACASMTNFPLPAAFLAHQNSMTRGAISPRFLLPVSEAAWCGLPNHKETTMFIGNFKPLGDNYTGVIQTLTFTTEAIFEQIEKKGENSPDYRITNGTSDIGVAWKKTSEAGNAYLSAQLDDPALAGPIACRLVKVGTTYALAWERSRKRS
jgi:uncharacterized protein (DUF736 family)